MDIFNKAIDRAIQKGWMPATDREAVISRSTQMAAKYQFPLDNFAILVNYEAMGFNPSCTNTSGCSGIIQFCADKGGQKTVNKKVYAINTIKNMTLLQQLEVVDGYFEDIKSEDRQGAMKDVVHLYFYVLYPYIAKNYEKFGENENFYNDPKVKGLGRQAPSLYNPDGSMTKTSVRKALLEKTEAIMGGKIDPSDFIPAGGGENITNTGSLLNTLGGGILAQSISVCKEVFPVNFTLREALEYVGCVTARTVTTMSGGTSNAFPPGGMKGINTSSNFSISDFDLANTGLTEGSLGYPFNEEKPIGGHFCEARGSRRHAGTDLSAPIGTPVFAVADGQVIVPKIRGDGYEPGFLDIVSPQYAGLVTRYAHINKLKVPGDNVKKGEQIATIGNYINPRSKKSAPHLHIELRRDGGGAVRLTSIEDCKRVLLDPMLFCRGK